MTLPDAIDGPREEWVVRQRWFASKAREIAGLNLLRRVELSDDPALALELVEARFQAGTHELYQLLPGAPGSVEVLGALMGGEVAIDGVSFHGGVTPSGEMRAMGAEQSNSSVVFGEELVLKVFRRLEPGVNPELEMLRFLSARDFPNIAALAGWYEYSGELMHATLGILQEFVGSARDGWELAMDDPDGLAERIADLGRATGEMHSVLASDGEDPAFAPEKPSHEALSLLTATIDEQIELTFLDLPSDNPALEPIMGRARGDPRALAAHVARRCRRAAHPPPRRLPPRPDPVVRRPLDHPRLRGRARALAARAPPQALAAARRRRHAALVRLRGVGVAAVARRPGADRLGGAGACGLPRGLPRDGRPDAAAGRAPARPTSCCRSSSSRKRSTNCATSSTTGPTGCRSP